jgi:hypothetical protein
VIVAMLDLSTAHLPEPERAQLQGDPGRFWPVRVVDHGYGWFVHVAADDPELGGAALDDLEQAGLASLALVMRYAQERNCSWINFDQDALTVEGLPTFD